jgi:hypothetical protein
MGTLGKLQLIKFLLIRNALKVASSYAMLCCGNVVLHADRVLWLLVLLTTTAESTIYNMPIGKSVWTSISSNIVRITGNVSLLTLLANRSAWQPQGVGSVGACTCS